MDLDHKLTEGNWTPTGGLKARNIKGKGPFKSWRPSHEPIKPQPAAEIISSNDAHIRGREPRKLHVTLYSSGPPESLATQSRSCAMATQESDGVDRSQLLHTTIGQEKVRINDENVFDADYLAY
jgi:hypothetical protein